MENNLLGIHSLGQSWNVYLKEEISQIELEQSNNTDVVCSTDDDRVTTFSYVDMELYGHCPILKPFVGYVCLRSGQERPCGTVLVPEGLAHHMNVHHRTRSTVPPTKSSVRSGGLVTLQCKTVSSSETNARLEPVASTSDKNYIPCATLENNFTIEKQPVKGRITTLQCKTVSSSYNVPKNKSASLKCGNISENSFSVDKSEMDDLIFNNYDSHVRDVLESKPGVVTDVGHDRLSKKPFMSDVCHKSGHAVPLRSTPDSTETLSFVIPNLLEKFPILADLQCLRSTGLSSRSDIFDKKSSWNSSSILAAKSRMSGDRSCSSFTFTSREDDCTEENTWTLRPIRTFKNTILERRNHKIRSVLKTIFEKPYLPSQFKCFSNNQV